MDTTIQQAAVADFEAELSDGETYSFAPVTAAMWVDFCRWLNKKAGVNVNRVVHFDRMLEGAQSIEGMMQLAYRSFSANHQATYPEFEKLLQSVSLLKDIFKATIDFGDDDSEDSGEGSDPPNQ